MRSEGGERSCEGFCECVCDMRKFCKGLCDV